MLWPETIIGLFVGILMVFFGFAIPLFVVPQQKLWLLNKEKDKKRQIFPGRDFVDRSSYLLVILGSLILLIIIAGYYYEAFFENISF